MRGLTRLPILGILLASVVPAATLEQLSLDDMIQKSTAIVRARPVSAYSAKHGSLIYTHYRVQVSESWKGASVETQDVVVLGGLLNGLRQSFPGSPSLTIGSEYVLFLWTGRSGLTHIIGLSQGLFSLTTGPKGEVLASRPAVTDSKMVDRMGRNVSDSGLSISLNDLRQRVTASLHTGGAR